MPNWCANSLKLIATTAESEAKLSEIVRELARATAANESAAIFALIKPVPEALMIVAGWSGDAAEQAAREAAEQNNRNTYGYANWYDYCIGEWGTKWDAKGATYDLEGNQVTIFFDTAWSPPMGIYHALENMGFKVEATYVEQGMGFIGYYRDGRDTCEEMDQLQPELDDEDDEFFGALCDNIDKYFTQAGINHCPTHMGG